MGEATDIKFLANQILDISIHASRGGSDRGLTLGTGPFIPFQSTLPVGEATRGYRYIYKSIGFQSTLPVGEATAYSAAGRPVMIFQSTLPVGEATLNDIPTLLAEVISIHASRGGSDTLSVKAVLLIFDFNPRFPWGKRHPDPALEWTKQERISIHASRGGSDCMARS